MKIKSRWVERLLHADKDRAERRAAEDFFAYWWDGAGVREDVVRDVSSTGVFVSTREVWPRGKTLWMAMQRRGLLEATPERRITAQLKVMRPLTDGVGCMFVSAAQPEERAWEDLVEHAVAVTGVHDMAGFVKALAAVGFLHQICPDRAMVGLLRDNLSSLRLKRALEILCGTADLVRNEERADELRAPKGLVEELVEAGSDSQGEEMTARWATLLARSCTTSGGDQSLGPVVKAMSGLTDGSLSILLDASERARRGQIKPGPVCASPVSKTLGELVDLTGIRETLVQQAVQQLADLGLLEPRERLLVVHLNAKVDVTPSQLGLRAYAETSRHRGTVEEFYQQPA